MEQYSKLSYTIIICAAIAASSHTASADSNLSFYGGYTFKNAAQGHQIFGPNAAGGASPYSDSKSGTWAAVKMRYSWGDQFAGLTLQNINVGTGAPNNGISNVIPEIGIEGRIFDLEYGRGFNLGNGTAKWAVGLRHAQFDTETYNFGVGTGPLHEFSGTGIHVGIETEKPLQAQGWSWFSEGGISILKGDIVSSGQGGWGFADATDTSTTATALDAKIGFNYQAGNNMSWMFGYQVQYWNDVTVAISDDSGAGLNVGKSDLLFHGPFVGLKMTF